MPAPTVSDSNTTTTDGTEQSLTTQTTGGTYVFTIDTNAMALGDAIEIRVYTKVLSGSTKRVAYIATYTQVQGEPNKFSVPVPASHYIEVTLKRTAGTDRAYDWELMSF